MEKSYYIDISRFDEERNKDKLKEIRNKLNITTDIDSADYILAIGGDGCLLNSISNFKDYNKPFVGIHGGTVGYYMQNLMQDNKLSDNVVNILNKGNLHITEFPLLKIKAISETGEEYKGYAFGDCWVERSKPNCLKYNICLKTEKMPLFCSKTKFVTGDGILFSTAAGSTGYAKNILNFIMPIGSNDILVAPIHSTIDKRQLVGFNMDQGSNIIIDIIDTDFRIPRLNVDGKSIVSNETGLDFVPKHLEITMSKTKKVKLAHVDEHFLELKSFDYLIN